MIDLSEKFEKIARMQTYAEEFGKRETFRERHVFYMETIRMDQELSSSDRIVFYRALVDSLAEFIEREIGIEGESGAKLSSYGDDIPFYVEGCYYPLFHLTDDFKAIIRQNAILQQVDRMRSNYPLVWKRDNEFEEVNEETNEEEAVKKAEETANGWKDFWKEIDDFVERLKKITKLVKKLGYEPELELGEDFHLASPIQWFEPVTIKKGFWKKKKVVVKQPKVYSNLFSTTFLNYKYINPLLYLENDKHEYNPEMFHRVIHLDELHSAVDDAKARKGQLRYVGTDEEKQIQYSVIVHDSKIQFKLNGSRDTATIHRNGRITFGGGAHVILGVPLKAILKITYFTEFMNILHYFRDHMLETTEQTYNY